MSAPIVSVDHDAINADLSELVRKRSCPHRHARRIVYVPVRLKPRNWFYPRLRGKGRKKQWEVNVYSKYTFGDYRNDNTNAR